MRDHQHPFAGMALEDVVEKAAHPRGERVERLRVMGARPFPCAPAREGVGVALLDLVAGQPFPRAEAALAQARIEPDVQAEPSRHDLCGLPRARQVARVDSVDLLRQVVGELASLVSPAGVQGGVRVALPAAVAVPVGLAMASEKERRHEARLASQWTSA